MPLLQPAGSVILLTVTNFAELGESPSVVGLLKLEIVISAFPEIKSHAGYPSLPAELTFREVIASSLFEKQKNVPFAIVLLAAVVLKHKKPEYRPLESTPNFPETFWLVEVCEELLVVVFEFIFVAGVVC